MDALTGGGEVSRLSGNIEGVKQSLFNDRYTSDVNRFFVGLIVEVKGQNAEGFYTTESVRYDIKAAFPDAAGLVMIRDQVPSVRLWPSNQYLDAGKLKGTNVVGVMLGDLIRWIFYEPALVEECAPPPAPSPLGLTMSAGGLVTSVTPDAGPGSGPGGGGGTPTANPGEV